MRLGKHYFVIAILIIAALVASVWLMPRPQELALMQMKDKHFQEARIAYEQQLGQGTLTLEVANHLTDLYLQIGAVDKAIDTMEKFVAIPANKDNIDALTKLGTLYQYAQRPDDYMRNLERINQIKPKAENLQALSDIYNFKGQYDKQAETLREMILTEKGKDAKHFTDLATIQAAQHDYASAIGTLTDLQKTHPNDFNFSDEALLVSLLLDNKQSDLAEKTASDWVAKHDSADEGAELINILHFKGSIPMANTLMARYSDDKINASGPLLEAYVLLQLGQNKDDVAFKRLKDLYEAKRLPPQLNGRLLFLAAERGDKELTHELLANTQLNTLTESQLLALVELSIMQNDPALLKQMSATFRDENARTAYPALSAGLAVANHQPNAPELLARLDSTQLANEQVLQIANICAREKRYDCTGHFIAKLPDADKLTDAEIASVGDLYLEMHQWDKGYTYLHNVMQTRKSIVIEEVAILFDAARGENAAVKTWLAQNPDAISPRLLTDIYFAAYNNHQYATAASVAEFFNDKYNTRLSRSLLANAYIKAGRYASAVQMLKDSKPWSEDDENNYLTALSKLARKDPAYRRELASYASAKLNSPISPKRKLALIYALVDAGEGDVAMPAIRELALHKGGQWVGLYAEMLEKKGRYEEARTFWIQVAQQPTTSPKQKEEIAYTLLDHGYKADAEAIFTGLAAKAAPDSKQVAELLYLWGPRPAPEQMAWLDARYSTAATPRDKDRWATLISNAATPGYMLEFVSRHPESMNNPKIAAIYFDALVDEGRFAAKRDDYIAQAKQTGDVTMLRQYAAVAQSNGYKREARQAYQTIIAIDPADYVALRQAGVSAFGQADYSASKKYLGRYVKQYNAQTVSDADAYLAFFYYGEILRQEHHDKQAATFYRATLELMGNNAPNTADNLAIRAESQVWSGDAQGGLQTFDYALGAYPQNDDLRSDYASTLVDLKQYDKARKLLLAQAPHAGAGRSNAAALALPAFANPIKNTTLLDSDRELLVQFAEPVSKADAAKFKDIAAVSYAGDGYDTLLLTAPEGSKFQVAAKAPAPTMKGADTDIQTVQLVADTSIPQTQADRQTVLRYQLLLARIDLETGHVYAAAKRLNGLMPEYKNDAQLLGFTANAENYGGNWPRAEQLLKTARSIDPENQDLADLERDARREHAQNVQLDLDWIRYGHSNEYVTGVNGYVDATSNVQVGASVQNNYVQGHDLRLSDGTVGSKNGDHEREEIWALFHTENGQQLKGALFSNNDTAGAGGYYSFLSPLGQTDLTAEYKRPYWDLPEGVLDDANRDRIAFLQTYKPTTRWVIDGGLGYNRYNVKDISNVTDSVSGQLDVVYKLWPGITYEKPWLNIGYGLDAEYIREDKESIDSTGQTTRDFPLFSREIHSLYGDLGYDFSPATYGDALLGWEYDRIGGGNGPEIAGKITHEFNQAFDVQLRASYALAPANTQNSIGQIGGYLRWRF